MVARPVQQRLFTGGIFSEEINDQLVGFARSHGLTCPVWVPFQCFQGGLKHYGVTIRPAASMLAVRTLSSRSPYHSCMLVNAEHTSHRVFLEDFFDRIRSSMSSENHLVCSPLAIPSDIHASSIHASRNPPIGSPAGATDESKPQETYSAPAVYGSQYPLSVEGDVITNPHVLEALCRSQVRHQRHCSYWTSTKAKGACSVDGGGESWYHVEDHQQSGQFNPIWCMPYIPHTLVNHAFPYFIQRAMRERAWRYGYVSRLWLSEEEAWRCFGAELAADCSQHDPPIWCRQFSNGVQQEVYYCADQFNISPSKIPREKDVHLAASGVDVGREKLRPFPLIYSLYSGNSRGEPHTCRSAHVTSSNPAADEGTVEEEKSVPSSVVRQERFKQLQEAYTNVVVWDSKLRGLSVFSRHRLLRGWNSPYFIRMSSVLQLGLTLREDAQQGIVLDTIHRLPSTFLSFQQECWVNASQLTEPAVVRELVVNPPTVAIWGSRLRGVIGLNCARLQVIHRYAESRWMAGQAVSLVSHWKLRPGAVAVPLLNNATASPATTPANAYPILYYNIQDIMGITFRERQMLDDYIPFIPRSNLVVQKALKVFLTLRALQAGFQSPVWIELEGSRGAHGLASSPCEPQLVKPRRTGPCNMFGHILPSDTTSVFYKGRTYVNEEVYHKKK